MVTEPPSQRQARSDATLPLLPNGVRYGYIGRNHTRIHRGRRWRWRAHASVGSQPRSRPRLALNPDRRSESREDFRDPRAGERLVEFAGDAPRYWRLIFFGVELPRRLK